MKYFFVVILAAITLPAGLWASLPEPPPGMRFVPTVQDDFNESKLDDSKWILMTRERKFSTEARDAVRLTNGCLQFYTYSEPDAATGQLKHYSGFVRTTPDHLQAKGYFEARLRLFMPEAIDSCFWLMSPTMTRHGDDPARWAEDGAEFDILEYVPHLKGDYLPTIHWGDYGTNKQSFHASAKVKLQPGEWHTYGMLWDDTGYAFYCDNRLIARFTPKDKSPEGHLALPIFTAPANIQLSAGPNKWAGKPPDHGFGTRQHPTLCMEAEYVHVWKLVPEPEFSTASPQ